LTQARMSISALLSSCCVLATCFAAAQGHAQAKPAATAPGAPAPFGARSSVVFDRLLQYDSAAGTYGLLGVSVQRTDLDGTSPARIERRTIGFAPAADWFPLRNLSLGLAASIGNTRSELAYPQMPDQVSERTTVSFRPRVGYVVPLTSELSLWPRLSVGYQHSIHADLSAGAYGAVGGPLVNGWNASIGLPLIVAPSRNLFFAVGPELRWDSTKEDDHENYDGSSWSAKHRGFELAMVGGLGLVFGR